MAFVHNHNSYSTFVGGVCESFDLAMAASVNQDDLLEVLENEEGDTNSGESGEEDGTDRWQRWGKWWSNDGEV